MSLPIPVFRTNHIYPKATKANTGLLSKYKPLKDKTPVKEEKAPHIEAIEVREEISNRFKTDFMEKLVNPRGLKKFNYTFMEVKERLECQKQQ